MLSNLLLLWSKIYTFFLAQDVPATVSPVFLILIGVIVLAIVGTVAVVIIIRTHTYQEKRQQKGNVKEKNMNFFYYSVQFSL